MESVRLPPISAPGPRTVYSIPVSSKWEYLVDEVSLDNVPEALQGKGVDCWELVSALKLNKGLLYLIFKRPEEEEA